MNGEYRIGDVVLGNWTLVKLLGEGAYGKVYEAHREDFGTVYNAAIKIMTIPQSQSEVTSARAEGMDDESVTAYFRSFVEDVVQEFALMSKLKGTANIVSYEDHSVTPHSEGIGWDILIRMELLTPMLNYMESHQMTRSDVIKLGIDMCRALELCQRYNIIHRDIKPENIFISETGDYKLGDFGVARTLEKTTGGLSKKGTYTYMAPEIYRDEKYGSTVDIYSLGVVLYRLLNNNRAPFLPAPPKPITHSERERALVRRISGEQIPPPANAEGRLAEIVLKACAYDPKERYSSPLQMRQELEAIQYHRAEDDAIYGRSGKIDVDSRDYTKMGKSEEDDKTVYEPRNTEKPAAGAEDEKTVYEARKTEISVAETEDEKTVYAPPEKVTQSEATGPNQVPKKKKIGLIAGICAGVLALIVLLIVLLPKAKPQETVAPSAEPSVSEQLQTEIISQSQPSAETESQEASSTMELVSGRWNYGILKVLSPDDMTIHVDLMDDHIPDHYTISEIPGTYVPSWNVILVFDQDVSGQVYLDGYDSIENIEPNGFFDAGGNITSFSIKNYSYQNNTFSFDVPIPTSLGITTKNLKEVYVNIGTEQPNFVDHYSFPVSLDAITTLEENVDEPSFSSVTVENLGDIDQEWDIGALRVTTENRVMHVEITDKRVAEDYVMPEQPGDTNAPCWRLTLTLDSGDTKFVETFLGIDMYGEETLSFCRSGAPDHHGFVQTGNVSSFDIYFDTPPYTMSNIQKVTLQMVRSLDTAYTGYTYLDSHEFTIGSIWHEVKLEPVNSELQILGYRYRGGPEIEKIELYTYGGVNGTTELDTYFVDNKEIAAISAAAYFGGAISEEDIEMYRPFGEKYLREMDIPLSPQSPIGINYGPISTGDFSTQDHSDYLLWFGANTKGEIVSTIIVEIGVPVVDFSTLPDAANTSSSKKDLPSVNDAAMLTGKITTTFEALPDQYALLKKEYAGMDISPETILLLDEPYTFVDADGEVVTIKGAIVPSSDAHGYEGKHVTILGKLAKQSGDFEKMLAGPSFPEGYTGNGLISWNPYGPYMFSPFFIQDA